MSVIVAPSAAAPDEEYRDGLSVQYDSDGYLTVLAGTEEEPKQIAVWAPGQWQRADIRADRS